MSRRRKSFTEKRRARLARKWDRLDKLESRNTITEPISLLGLATGSLRGMVQLGLMQADGGGLLAMTRLAQQAQQGPAPIAKAPSAANNSVPMGILVPDTGSSGAAGGGISVQDPSLGASPPQGGSAPRWSSSTSMARAPRKQPVSRHPGIRLRPRAAAAQCRRAAAPAVPRRR